jgi:hypothetical protein
MGRESKAVLVSYVVGLAAAIGVTALGLPVLVACVFIYVTLVAALFLGLRVTAVRRGEHIETLRERLLREEFME